MKIDHAAREEAKRKRMAHPDWEKYSGFPPPDVSGEKPKKRQKATEAAPETDENGDSN